MGLTGLGKKSGGNEVRNEIKLCVKAYEQGDMQNLEKKLKKMYAKSKEDAIGGLSFISASIKIASNKDLEKAKKLREIWKAIDSTSYKKYGVSLKKKYKEFLLKNTSNLAEGCLSLFNQGKTDTLFRNLKGIYESEPNICKHILKYVAQNSRCIDDSKREVTKKYAKFWSDLDSSHYNKYQAKLKQDYIKTISQLSKSSVQAFLKTCETAITDGKYAKCATEVQKTIRSITSQFGSMHSYGYYNYTYLNKNDDLARFLSSFMQAFIVPMGQILISLFVASGEGDEGSAKTCYNSLVGNLKSRFNLTFKKDGGVDDIINQSEQIWSSSTLEDIVKKLNEVLSLLSKFKV